MKIRYVAYSQSIWSPSVMYRSRRLLGRVAVGARPCARPSATNASVVERGHVGRDVLLRVAVRPQDELAVGVERDVGPDLLDAVDDAAVARSRARAWVSGAENGAAPRYVEATRLPDEPPQQPHR